MKFIKEDYTKGRKVWRFVPKKYLRDALGVSGTTFTCEHEAKAYSHHIQQELEDHKRRLADNIAIPDRTVDGLIAYYFTTSEFKDLAENSKTHYRLVLRTASEHALTSSTSSGSPFGGMLYRSITSAHADKLKQQIEEKVSKHRATHSMKALRRVWYVGMRHGKGISTNPFFKMGLKALKRRTKRWTQPEITKFMHQADEMGYWGLGTMVLLCHHLCQRPGDMRQLRWSDYQNGVFTFVQEKTGTKVAIPETQAIRERLDSAPRSKKTDTIVFYRGTGAAYDRRLYSKHAAKVRKAAGIDESLFMSDLRRTGATEMANAGCTDDEMRSVTGHKSRDVLGIYLILDETTSSQAMNKRFA